MILIVTIIYTSQLQALSDDITN